MSRRDDRYDVVYVSRPREVVYEIPRRAATSRDYLDDYDSRSYASDRYAGRPRQARNDYNRDPVIVNDDYGSDVYYLPSRGSRDVYQSASSNVDYSSSDRRITRFAPAIEDRQRRRRSSDEHVRRRVASPDSPPTRSDRGRRDERQSSPARRLRSAMRGGRDESPGAQKRARARGVSFREKEATMHDVGHQKHERPGYEARAVGQYLRHDDDDDLASETYAIRPKSRRYS